MYIETEKRPPELAASFLIVTSKFPLAFGGRHLLNYRAALELH